jgi:hypothetical protein
VIWVVDAAPLSRMLMGFKKLRYLWLSSLSGLVTEASGAP